MPYGPAFVLTEDQKSSIKKMEAEKIRLEQLIAKSQQELAAINERLRAISVLLSPLAANGSDVPSLSEEEAAESVGSGRNMTEAIEKIANESAAPVPRATLKRLLAEQGYPADRLGNYFYTAIHRLKMRDRIQVKEDGSVWRPSLKI